jgi:hypothetical protein
MSDAVIVSLINFTSLGAASMKAFVIPDVVSDKSGQSDEKPIDAKHDNHLLSFLLAR